MPFETRCGQMRGRLNEWCGALRFYGLFAHRVEDCRVVGHADVASRRSIDYCRLLMIIVQFGLVCFKEEAYFSKLVSQHVLKMLPPAWKLWNPLRCRRHVYNYAVVPQGIVRPFEWAKPPHFFYLCCAFWSQGILMCFKMLQPTQFQDVKRMRKLLDVAFQNLNRWGWVPGEVRQWRLKMTTTQVKKWWGCQDMGIQWVCEACISKRICVTTLIIYLMTIVYFTERIFCNNTLIFNHV